jgi:transposase
MIHRSKPAAFGGMILPRGKKPGHKKLMLHVDNASAHTAGMTNYFCSNNSLQQIPQPPYSPDIIPSDF